MGKELRPLKLILTAKPRRKIKRIFFAVQVQMQFFEVLFAPWRLNKLVG